MYYILLFSSSYFESPRSATISILPKYLRFAQTMTIAKQIYAAPARQISLAIANSNFFLKVEWKKRDRIFLNLIN